MDSDNYKEPRLQPCSYCLGKGYLLKHFKHENVLNLHEPKINLPAFRPCEVCETSGQVVIDEDEYRQMMEDDEADKLRD